MTDRDLRRDLAALDAELGRVDLPPGSLARLRGRLAPRARRRRWLVPVTVAAIAVAVVIVVRRTTPRPAIAGFAARGDGVELVERPDHDVEVVRGAGEVDVVARGVRMAVAAGSRFRRDDAQVRVVAGRVGFTVNRRAAGERPFVVRVSHGKIIVVGTEFSVAQAASGGRVELARGGIRFEADDGRAVTLAPGEALDWPLPPPPAAPSGPPAPGPAPDPEPPAPVVPRQLAPPPSRPAPPLRLPPAPAAAAELTLALQEIDALRIRQQFASLAARITLVLPQVSDPASRDSLHYELCDVLAYRLRDRARACTCLADHRRDFGLGRYGTAIERGSRELGCGAPP